MIVFDLNVVAPMLIFLQWRTRRLKVFPTGVKSRLMKSTGTIGFMRFRECCWWCKCRCWWIERFRCNDGCYYRRYSWRVRTSWIVVGYRTNKAWVVIKRLECNRFNWCGRVGGRNGTERGRTQGCGSLRIDVTVIGWVEGVWDRWKEWARRRQEIELCG